MYFLALSIAVIVSAVLILPVWHRARRSRPLDYLWFAVALPAGVLWLMLAGSGVGAQSLGNLEELGYLGIGAALASYLGIFALMPRISERSAQAVAATAVAILAVVLRLTMPVLPE